MVATLDHGRRGLRDRAILLIGFAGGLRRSEITGLDCGPEQTEDGAGWIEFLDQGVVIRVRGKTGWREVEIGRGSKRCGRRGPGGGNGGASRGGKHESP
jgi:integrase